MGFFDSESTVATQHAEFEAKGAHESDISHQLLAGAAAFTAAREYEKHVEKNGKPVKHSEAKALIAGFAAAFIDREVETRGLDEIDKLQAQREATKHAANAVGPEYNDYEQEE